MASIKTFDSIPLATGKIKNLEANTNFNDVIEDGIYCISGGTSYTNAPNIPSGYLRVFRFQSGIITQIAWTLDASIMYSRRLLSGSWSGWVETGASNIYSVTEKFMGTLATGSDLDSVAAGTTYALDSTSTYSNCPVASGIVRTLRFSKSSSNIIIQVIYTFNHKVLMRHKINSWARWTTVTGQNIADGYYAFGDSITYGQIGGASGQSAYNYPVMVGRNLGLKTYNEAVGGQGLIKDWDYIHTNYINNLDMSDAVLITIGWAYNDSGYYPSLNFGSYADTGSTTFIGKYFTIMKEFQQKCPLAQIVLITGYGYPDGSINPTVKPTLVDQFTHEYTFADGQKSIKEIYDELEKMANSHGWPCVNQSKGTAINQYNVDEMIGDQIHPTNIGYKFYGNHIAGRVAQFYANTTPY